MDSLATSGLSTVSSVLVMGFLASVAIVLRYLAKAQTQTGFAADDYWIGFSLAAYWANAGAMIWGIFVGGGGLDMHKIIERDYAGIAIYLKVVVGLERLDTAITKWLTGGVSRWSFRHVLMPQYNSLSKWRSCSFIVGFFPLMI